MDKLMTGGKSHLVFVIGGSLGLSNDILKCADYKHMLIYEDAKSN